MGILQPFSNADRRGKPNQYAPLVIQFITSAAARLADLLEPARLTRRLRWRTDMCCWRQRTTLQ